MKTRQQRIVWEEKKESEEGWFKGDMKRVNCAGYNMTRVKKRKTRESRDTKSKED